MRVLNILRKKKKCKETAKVFFVFSNFPSPFIKSRFRIGYWDNPVHIGTGGNPAWEKEWNSENICFFRMLMGFYQ